MTIAWGSLLIVCAVSIAAGVAVCALVSFALVGLSARVARPVGGPEDGARPRLGAGAGTAIAAVCLLAALAVVGYGLYIVIA